MVFRADGPWRSIGSANLWEFYGSHCGGNGYEAAVYGMQLMRIVVGLDPSLVDRGGQAARHIELWPVRKSLASGAPGGIPALRMSFRFLFIGLAGALVRIVLRGLLISVIQGTRIAFGVAAGD